MTMPGIRGAGGILLASGLLIGSVVEHDVAGLTPQEAAFAVSFLGFSLILAASIVDGFGRHWTHGVQAIAVTGGILIGALVLYNSRSEFLAVLDRTIGDIALGRTAVTPEGEVVAARRSDGTFVVSGRVNGKEARFIFDTGASTIVLRAEDAAGLGVDPENLAFSIPVSTANGMALAAPVTIASLAVGPIIERNVPALVAKAGVLQINLLGMTFLERLESYEVRGNRLILRGKGA